MKLLKVLLVITLVLLLSVHVAGKNYPLDPSKEVDPDRWTATGRAGFSGGEAHLLRGGTYKAGSVILEEEVSGIPLRIQERIKMERHDGKGAIVFFADGATVYGDRRSGENPFWKGFSNGYYLMTHEDRGFALFKRVEDSDVKIAEGVIEDQGNLIKNGIHEFDLEIERYNSTHEHLNFRWNGREILTAFHDFDTSESTAAFYWKAGFIPVDVSVLEASVYSEVADPGPSINRTVSPTNLTLISDSRKETLAAVSTGAEVVYGDQDIDEEIAGNRVVYEIGDNRTIYPEVERRYLPELVNATRRTRCSGNLEEDVYTAMAASHNQSSVACTGEGKTLEKSIEGLKESYIRSVAENGGEINHVFVSSEEVAPVAASMASGQEALIQVVGTGDPKPEQVRGEIEEASEFLADHGMYVEGREQYTEGLYLSLIGVPPVQREDPVESGNWSLKDPRDGDSFTSDLPYADLDQDGRLDAAVGRYPTNRSLASRMYLRSRYYDGKKALVASEYLHQNWPVILAYIGGGMFSGKSIGRILEEQGHNVSRAVEYRASPEEFLVDLTPVKLEGVLGDSEMIGEKIGTVLGSSVGTAASHVYLAIKALNYVERGLEQYLEFEWSTAGLDTERALERLSGDDVSQLEDAAERAAENAVEKGIGKGLVDTLQKEGVQRAAAKAIYAFFWPERYPRLTEENLKEGISKNDLVYYTGVGNSSSWTLPNNYSSFLGAVKTGRYNGSESLGSEGVPENTARVVFDNSDLSGELNAPIKESFLEKGAATYLGASTVNYAPFSSEIDTRFFNQGYTVGESLKVAVNGFSEDSMTWDPVNLVARNNVKGKMLRSFRLYGNPEMEKDPEIRAPEFEKDVECGGGVCNLTLTLDTDFSIVDRGGDRGIDMEADDHMMKSFRPIVPVFSSEHALPGDAEIQDYEVDSRTRIVENVSVPVVEPLSHSGRVLEKKITAGFFPSEKRDLRVSEQIDGRKKLSLIQPGFRYNPANDTAELVEEVVAQISYRSPSGMDIDAEVQDNRTVEIESDIWNSVGAERGELLVQIRGREGSLEKTVEFDLDSRRKTVRTRFQVNRTGRFKAESYLFVGNHTIGPRTDTFVISPEERNISINVSTPPEVREGERFEAVISIDNPQVEGRNLSLLINGSEGVQTVFLHPNKYELEVPPRNSRNLEVLMKAFKPGDAELNVNAGTSMGQEDFEVMQTTEDGFRKVSEGSVKILRLETPQGRLDFRQGRKGTRSSLVTEDFRISEERSGGDTVMEAEKPDGSTRLIVEEGDKKITERNGMRLEEAHHLYQVLRREKNKLVERYRLSDDSSRTASR
ncbi:MAG: C25 family cysteine peptidase [Candidatus Nanohaloarchaeota archaeon QJJ-7]|nr:C25 family cysteine peptidase [Candidatus Nanohaloarchaeota archaeon QJJ-7]